MSMTTDERNLLLLLAKMVLRTTTHLQIQPMGDDELRKQIARIEAAEDRAADEEKHLGRG